MAKNSIKKLVWSSVNTLLASLVMCFLLVAMASGLMKNDFGIILLQLLLMVVFLGLPYMNFRKLGLADQKAVQSGDQTEDLARGFKASVACIILLEASVVLLVLMKLGVVPDMLYLYKTLNPQFSGLAWFIAPVTTVMALNWGQIFCFALLPLLYPMAMGIGYLTGYKDTSWI